MDTTQQNRDSRLKKKQNENNVDSEMRREKDWKRKSFMVEDKRVERMGMGWTPKQSERANEKNKLTTEIGPNWPTENNKNIFYDNWQKREREKKKTVYWNVWCVCFMLALHTHNSLIYSKCLHMKYWPAHTYSIVYCSPKPFYVTNKMLLFLVFGAESRKLHRYREKNAQIVNLKLQYVNFVSFGDCKRLQ